LRRPGSQRIHSATTKAGKPTVKLTGTALSYRFVRDDKGWRVFVSAEAREVEQVSRQELGAIGVDINADHLAVSETDRFGNLIGTRRIDLVTYGKTTDQAKALIGDAAVRLPPRPKTPASRWYSKVGFPEEESRTGNVKPKQARLISSFRLQQVASGHQSRLFPRRRGSDRSQPGVYLRDRCSQSRPATRHQSSSGRGLRHRPARIGFLRTSDRAARPSCPLATAAMSPLSYL
jgi:hypothetical protein